VSARERMRAALATRLAREQTALTALRSRPVLADPVTFLDRQQEVVDAARTALRRTLTWRLDRLEADLTRLRTQVVALSPAATLDRGYAVVRRNGHVVSDAGDVEPGDSLEVMLARGRIDAAVTAVHPRGGSA